MREVDDKGEEEPGPVEWAGSVEPSCEGVKRRGSFAKVPGPRKKSRREEEVLDGGEPAVSEVACAKNPRHLEIDEVGEKCEQSATEPNDKKDALAFGWVTHSGVSL